jgi:hypothetical protein
MLFLNLECRRIVESSLLFGIQYVGVRTRQLGSLGFYPAVCDTKGEPILALTTHMHGVTK